MIVFTKVALPYGWLGNMSPHPVVFGGLTWRTVEHLFQASRFPKNSPVREKIRAEKSPMGAKMVAKKHASEMIVQPRSQEDLGSMRFCLELKINQHPSLCRQLLATGDETIVEDATKRQSTSGLFWGMAKQEDGSWIGENMLGHLWGEVRSNVRSSS